MTLLYDGLRDAITERKVGFRADPQGRRFLALSVRFAGSLPPAILSAIHAEVPHATAARLPGIFGPVGVELSPDLITLILEPIDPATLRLDTLLSALAWSGSPLGSPLSAYVVVQLCRALQSLHNAVGADGLPRVHGEIHAGAVLVGPGGALRVIGAGLPALSAVMLPRLSNRGDRHRLLSPEAARGEPLDARADVYSLGVLYYELLSGHRYREKLSATAIAQAAIERRPPELPGALPDPRPELVQVLARALSPHPDQRFQNARLLSEAIANELASARIPLAPGSVLERMVDEFVPAGVERGPQALLQSEHDPAAFEAIMSGVAETISSPPAPVRIPGDAPTAPTPPAAPDPWAKVLGEQIEDAPPAAPSPAPPEERRTVSLPMPPAQPQSGLTLPAPPPSSGPTQPLSGEHLASLARPTSRARPYSPSRPADDEGKNTPIRIALGLAAVALVVAVGFGLKARPSGDVPDAGLAGLALADAGAPVAAVPDGGVVEAKPIGLLTVLSKPSGAAVEVNGGYVGRTPLVMRHEFENRPYKIAVLADGYEPWEKTEYPDAKMAISVIAELVKK